MLSPLQPLLHRNSNHPELGKVVILNPSQRIDQGCVDFKLNFLVQSNEVVEVVWIENLNPGEFLKLLDDEMKSRKMRRYTSERFPLVKYGAATLLVPDQSGTFPHELVACSKNDPIFVVNRDNMGHKNDDDNSQIVQNVLGQLGDSGLQDADHCFTTAAFFQQTLYFIGNNDVIKAFSLDTAGGKLSLTPTSKGSFVYDFPGGQPVVSSNGSTNGKVYVGTKTALVVFGLN